MKLHTCVETSKYCYITYQTFELYFFVLYFLDIEEVDIAVLASMSLTSMDLRGNPVCELEAFASEVTSRLPKLTSLNGCDLLASNS